MRIDYEDPIKEPMTTNEKLFSIPYIATILVAGIFICIKLFFKNRPKNLDQLIDLAFYISQLMKDEVRSASFIRALINVWVWIKVLQYIVNKISA